MVDAAGFLTLDVTFVCVDWLPLAGPVDNFLEAVGSTLGEAIVLESVSVDNGDNVESDDDVWDSAVEDGPDEVEKWTWFTVGNPVTTGTSASLGNAGAEGTLSTHESEYFSCSSVFVWVSIEP